jgi:hypothetical protein
MCRFIGNSAAPSSYDFSLPGAYHGSSMDQYRDLGIRAYLERLAAQDDRGDAVAAVRGHDDAVAAIRVSRIAGRLTIVRCRTHRRSVAASSLESAMRLKTTNIDSLLGRARRAQYRYEALSAQLKGLLELAFDAEASGRPVGSPIIRQLEAIVEADEKLSGEPGMFPKRRSLFPKRKTQGPKVAPPRRRKRVKPSR